MMKSNFVIMIISSIAMLVSGILLIVMVPNTIKLYAEGDENLTGDDVVFKLESCDRDYYRKRYDDLYYQLVLSDCLGEEFDMYWEIVNGYSDYYMYIQWSNCDEDKMPGSSEKAEYYREKVIENANNVKFSLNSNKLEELAGKVE